MGHEPLSSMLGHIYTASSSVEGAILWIALFCGVLAAIVIFSGLRCRLWLTRQWQQRRYPCSAWRYAPMEHRAGHWVIAGFVGVACVTSWVGTYLQGSFAGDEVRIVIPPHSMLVDDGQIVAVTGEQGLICMRWDPCAMGWDEIVPYTTTVDRVQVTMTVDSVERVAYITPTDQITLPADGLITTAMTQQVTFVP